jgi:hypothetical protein
LEQKPKHEDEPVNPPSVASSATSPVTHSSVDDEETTKAEIGQRLASFHHITENTFLCDR